MFGRLEHGRVAAVDGLVRGRVVVVVDEAGETLGEYEATHDAIHAIVAAPRPVSKRSAKQWKRLPIDWVVVFPECQHEIWIRFRGS